MKYLPHFLQKNKKFITKVPKIFVVGLVMGLSFPPVAPAQGTADDGHDAFKISDKLHETILQGLDELYNFNFDAARATFAGIKDQSAKHPMVNFGIAATEWWRVSALVLEPDSEQSKPFLQAVDECIEQAEKMSEGKDPTGEGHLVLGGALGLLGRWEATNREWVSAYFHGKKAYHNLSKALKINPKLLDANMGLGIFDYYVATLPAVVRALTFIGKGGDPQIGLDELTQAATKSTYARTSSKLFLSQILAQEQKRPDKAIEIIKELRAEYPRSCFMHMLQVIALYNADELPELKIVSRDLANKFFDGTYQKDYIAQAYFALGAVEFKQKEWKNASMYFSKGIEEGLEIDPWRTWSRLYLGYCYDAQGHRENAKKLYTDVLNRQRRWGSHDAAKDHLKNPFKPTDDETKILSL